MARVDHENQPKFSQPIRQIVLMVSVVCLTFFGAFIALPQVLPVFTANPQLNSFIFFVFLIGIIACFYQIFQLIGSVRWIKRFALDADAVQSKAPKLLASLATLLRARDAKMQVSSTSGRSILDSVATRIDEAREITRYIVNTLIFLGLLGTFYGLATTVPALVDTIRSLAPQNGEGGVEVFGRLMSGLEAQLSGMGVAFASSLLGLAGSLVVGLLELFASHGQNRFYRELEEWLSTITRVGLSAGDEEGGSNPELMLAVVEYMGQQVEELKNTMANAQASREKTDEHLNSLSYSIERMIQQMQHGDSENNALARVAAGQERLIAYFENEANNAGGGGGLDAESRMRLRSIDVQMLQILEEITAGRQQSVTELRSDMMSMMQRLKDGAENSAKNKG